MCSHTCAVGVKSSISDRQITLLITRFKFKQETAWELMGGKYLLVQWSKPSKLIIINSLCDEISTYTSAHAFKTSSNGQVLVIHLESDITNYEIVG